MEVLITLPKTLLIVLYVVDCYMLVEEFSKDSVDVILLAS